MSQLETKSGQLGNIRAGIESGTYLEETDKNITGCSVMISYARKDKPFVRLLHTALAADDRAIWVDWEDIPPSEDWLAEVYKGIERSDCFIFVISNASIQSEACGWEVGKAIQYGKRIIPVVCEAIDYRNVRKEIASLDWIFFHASGSDFEASVKLVIRKLDADFRHARYHTKLLCTALEWESNDFEKSLLLRGNDLVRASHWLSASALGKEPRPTTLHLSYIRASEELSSSMKKRKLIALFFAFVVAIGIIWPSWGVFFFSLVFSHLFVYFAAH